MPLIISNKNPVKIKWVKIAYEFNKNFEEISKFKSNKQCKERWWNHLNPSTNK